MKLVLKQITVTNLANEFNGTKDKYRNKANKEKKNVEALAYI